MLIYSKSELGRKAREFGFVRDAFEKMSRLIEILKFINNEPELKTLLALKGGTAINLAIFDLPRLSVDIDMDFTDNITRDEMMIKRDRINDLLGRYMASVGYTLKAKSRHTHALDSFIYSYINAAGSPDNLKIEINYMLRSHAILPRDNITQTNGVFSGFAIRMLDPIEIFASKIVALSSRTAARDLYDVSNMITLKQFDDSELIQLRKCVVFYLTISGNEIKALSPNMLNAISEFKVRTELHPMLRKTNRFDLQEACNHTSTFLNEKMMLTDNETMFVTRFNEGKFEPHLLFDDVNTIKRIEKHPMAMWRLKHIQNN